LFDCGRVCVCVCVWVGGGGGGTPTHARTHARTRTRIHIHTGTELTTHHSFMVSYEPDADLGLDMHTDDSDVTFNVCLGKEFTGAGLQFCGVLGARNHRHATARYTHVVGRCVVHLGAQRHGKNGVARSKSKYFDEDFGIDFAE
jgi:hypothetical protein